MQDIVLTEKESKLLQVLDKVYEQQKFIYDNNVQTIKNRLIVSAGHISDQLCVANPKRSWISAWLFWTN
jgi:NADH:ubiquinone oxidoreductase subunit E